MMLILRGVAMAREIEKDFDGFISPDGELISLKDTDRMFSLLTTIYEDQGGITRCLWALAHECERKGYHNAAFGYLEKILSLVDDLGERADCLIRMAVTMELVEDFHAALQLYRQAFDLPQKSDEIWYYLNNNTAYCLNKIGQYQEAEKYCRTAIGIDFNRHNAHKNLGIALQHQGQHVEAARSFMRATRLNPFDTRALAHLKELIASHPEILSENPDLLELLYECYQLEQGDSGASNLH